MKKHVVIPALAALATQITSCGPGDKSKPEEPVILGGFAVFSPNSYDPCSQALDRELLSRPFDASDAKEPYFLVLRFFAMEEWAAYSQYLELQKTPDYPIGSAGATIISIIESHKDEGTLEPVSSSEFNTRFQYAKEVYSRDMDLDSFSDAAHVAINYIKDEEAFAKWSRCVTRELPDLVLKFVLEHQSDSSMVLLHILWSPPIDEDIPPIKVSYVDSKQPIILPSGHLILEVEVVENQPQIEVLFLDAKVDIDYNASEVAFSSENDMDVDFCDMANLRRWAQDADGPEFWNKDTRESLKKGGLVSFDNGRARPCDYYLDFYGLSDE